MQKYTIYIYICIKYINCEFTLLARRIAPSVILFQLPGAISISPYVNNLQKKKQNNNYDILKKTIETDL
jgi:hypothetical protein